jgi:signal transduction histidine kinase
MSPVGQLTGFVERADLWRSGVGVLGSVAIAYMQVRFDNVDAPFFSLFFWCVTVTRFFGFVPAVATILASIALGNIYLLEPRGSFSMAGNAGYLCFFFALMAGMCAYMIVSIKLHVLHQQDLLTQAERTATHNKALADALGQAVTARDTFLAVAGHELKSPVTGLMLQTQVWQRRLAKREVDAQEMHRAWHRQSEALGRLATLVDNLLDVSRINGGQLQLNPAATDLSQMAQEVVGRFREVAQEAGCEVVVHAEPNVVGQWDKVRLEQVVANLLSNAVKYGAGAPVEITVRKSRDAAVLSVADQGRGISAADRERIFECFERVSIESHVEGLGLGLWIVRQIVDAAGGRIGVDSEEGLGATFKVTLPLQQPKTAHRAHAYAPAHGAYAQTADARGV